MDTVNEEHADALVEYIRTNGRVLIPELLDELERRGLRTTGRYLFLVPGSNHRWLWRSLFVEAVAVLDELTDRFGIRLIRATWWDYLLHEYDEPEKTAHWIPAAFVAVDPAEQVNMVWGTGRR